MPIELEASWAEKVGMRKAVWLNYNASTKDRYPQMIFSSSKVTEGFTEAESSDDVGCSEMVPLDNVYCVFPFICVFMQAPDECVRGTLDPSGRVQRRHGSVFIAVGSGHLCSWPG